MSAVFKFGADLAEIVEADTAEEIEPQAEADIAEHPLEDGSQLSDGVTAKPRRISLKLVFTADPEGRPDALPSGPARAEMARQRLLRAGQAGEIFQLEVDGQVFYPAAFSSVSAPRLVADGNARRVSVDVSELRIAQAEIKTIQKRRLGKSVRHKHKEADRGWLSKLLSANDAAIKEQGTADYWLNPKNRSQFRPESKEAKTLAQLPPPPAEVTDNKVDQPFWNGYWGAK